MNRQRLACLTILGAIALAACSGGNSDAASPTTPVTVPTTVATTSTTVAPTTTAVPTTTVAATTTTTLPTVLRMPLTGEPIDDPSQIPDRPAMAVKIENSEAARPQTGLNEADIVFEEIINDGYTRFAAVFQSQGVDAVGPIRSGRHPDIDILESLNHPLFVWSGGNGGVTYYIERSELVDLSYLHTSGYYRRAGRKAPHDLYTSTEAMWEKSPDDAVPPPVVFPYLRPGESIDGGQVANTIDITMDGIDVHWEYDPDTGRYYRSQEGREHLTDNSGQVSTENVVVMMANYLNSPIDERTPDAQVLGSNPVYVFTGGTVRSGSWLRFDTTDPFEFFDNFDDLNPIGLQPGRTWVELPRNIDGTLTWS